MRSRYSAFGRGEVDYLIRTWHPDKRGALDRPSLEETSQALRWVGLRILEVVDGSPSDDTGIVEFEARYEAAAHSGVMHERSRFSRVDGAWTYVDGATSEHERTAPRPPGRNEPCECGSGKKFKRCCGSPQRA